MKRLHSAQQSRLLTVHCALNTWKFTCRTLHLVLSPWVSTISYLFAWFLKCHECLQFFYLPYIDLPTIQFKRSFFNFSFILLVSLKNHVKWHFLWENFLCQAKVMTLINLFKFLSKCMIHLFLKKCLLKSIAVFNHIVYLLLSYRCLLHILYIIPLSDVYLANISSHGTGCLFTLFTM
jgi:hypothetical protein